ncbi:MAG: transcriptional regulator [Candidatus Binatia bacterium]|nr:transcriptional regulator [Candidatus Binatia bacterium]
MARIIKRYGNRKLYDTSTSRYVTLEGIARLVRAGEDVRVVDNETGEDLTAVTFAQIIFEEQKKPRPLVAIPVLRWLIQQGGEALQELRSSVERGREAIEEFAHRSMQQFTAATDARAAAGKKLLEELLEVPQKQLELLQQRIDAQVRASVEKLAAHPAVRKELNRIEESLHAVERKLARLRAKSGRADEHESTSAASGRKRAVAKRKSHAKAR